MLNLSRIPPALALLVLLLALVHDSAAQGAPAPAPPPPPPPAYPTASYVSLMSENMIWNSDLFSDKPEIMAANYAFGDIKGVINGTEEAVVRAVGACAPHFYCGGGAPPVPPPAGPPTRQLAPALTFFCHSSLLC